MVMANHAQNVWLLLPFYTNRALVGPRSLDCTSHAGLPSRLSDGAVKAVYNSFCLPQPSSLPKQEQSVIIFIQKDLGPLPVHMFEEQLLQKQPLI
jgi:hypothetical protein